MCGNFQMNSLSSSLARQITFIIIIIIIIQRKLLLVNFGSDNLFMFAIDLNWRDTIFSRAITPRWSTATDDDFSLLFQEIKKSKKESEEICFIQFNAFFFWRRCQSPSQGLQKVKGWSLTFWEFRLRWYQAEKTYRLAWLDVWCDYWDQPQYIPFLFKWRLTVTRSRPPTKVNW